MSKATTMMNTIYMPSLNGGTEPAPFMLTKEEAARFLRLEGDDTDNTLRRYHGMAQLAPQPHVLFDEVFQTRRAVTAGNLAGGQLERDARTESLCLSLADLLTRPEGLRAAVSESVSPSRLPVIPVLGKPDGRHFVRSHSGDSARNPRNMSRKSRLSPILQRLGRGAGR